MIEISCNNLICNIITNCTPSLEKGMYFFAYNALHHPNELVRLLLYVKHRLARYLSFKYKILREG